MPFEMIVSIFDSVVSFLLGIIAPLIMAFEIITIVYSPEFEFVENVISVAVNTIFAERRKMH